MWLFSNDPEFEKKQADIVGLYLHPPKNAFVVCLDEKTGLQANSLQQLVQPALSGVSAQGTNVEELLLGSNT
jgi:hypothetical protein